MDSNTDDRDPEAPPDVPADELQQALQWLEDLAGLTSGDPTAEETADSPFHGLVDDGAGDLPDWLREAPKEPVETQLSDGGEFESRLDWLAKMAERESIEELPTLEWRNLSGPPPPAADAPRLPDDTLPPAFPSEFLPVAATPPEPLAAEAVLVVPESLPDEASLPAAAPEAEAPAAPLPDATPAALWPDDVPVVPLLDEPAVLGSATPITPEALLDTLPPDEELPPIDDLDAAMAWIEELAASQDAPIEDVPSVADRALASKLLLEAGLSPDGLDLRRPGDEMALGDLSLLEGNTPVNAFVAAEDFADTVVLVETMAADQGRPVPAEYQVGEMPDAAEVSFEEAMAFLDELAADQEPLGAQTQPLEPFEAPAVETVLFVTDELSPVAELPTVWPAGDETPAEPWPAELEGAAEAEAAWAAEVAELDAAEPEEVWTAETTDAPEADAALAPGDAPWLEPASEESAVEWREPEIDRAAVEEVVPVLAPAPAAEAMTANGNSAATLEETLRALDALALPPGRSLAEFDASWQQSGAAPVRRDLPAAVEWLEIALGISVPTTPPAAPQWTDDELISQMPDDPDAVLAWLEQLAEEDTVDSSPQLSPTPETPVATGQPSAAGAPPNRTVDAAAAAEPLIDELSDADLENMPEDPDAVMAWLEGLAGGRTSAPAAPPIEPVLPIAPVSPVAATSPTSPTPPAPDQSPPVASSRSRRRRGRRAQPPVAPVEAAAEPPATDATVWDEPLWEATTGEAAPDLLPTMLTPDAPLVEEVDASIWAETADVAAPDIIPATLTPDAPLVEEVDASIWAETADVAAPDVTIERTAGIEPTLPEAPATAVIGEAEADVFVAPWVEQVLAAPLEATGEPPVEVDMPPPLAARPRRRGRPPKVAPTDVAAVAETAGEAVEEAAGTIDAAAEQAVDTAKALTQPPPEIEEPLPPAKPASWVDLLKPLK